jgi:hypothetical protein
VKMERLLTAYKERATLHLRSNRFLPLEVPVSVAFQNLVLLPVQTNCGFPLFHKMRLVILKNGRG